MEKLALLIARVREDQRLVNAFARFALEFREHRENGLGSSRPKPRSRDWLASWKCTFLFDEILSFRDIMFAFSLLGGLEL